MKKTIAFILLISTLSFWSCSNPPASPDKETTLQDTTNKNNNASAVIAPKIQTTEERIKEITSIFEKFQSHKTTDCPHHTLKEILAQGPEYSGAEIYKCNLTDSLTMVSIELDYADIFEWCNFYFRGNELICTHNGWAGFGSKSSVLIYDANRKPIYGTENMEDPNGKNQVYNKKIKNFKESQKSHLQYLKKALKEMNITE